MAEDGKTKNAAAVELGRRGGLKGGRARAAALTPEQRSASARIAALARHGDGSGLPIARCDGKLKLGGFEVGAYVIEAAAGPLRLLSQGGMIEALGMSRGSNPKLGRDRLGNFAAGKIIKPFISEDLANAIQNPILFRTSAGGAPAYGYKASALADLCEAVLKARDAGELQTQQLKIATACEVLLRGFARVGLDALVDEVTGYQEIRARDALSKILEKFVAKDLQPHVKTFNPDYYTEMFRLRQWNISEANDAQKPPLVGKLTNDIVYARLAPGVLEELRRQIPRDENGRLKHHMHRKLTPDLGHPKLREHLAAVIMAMKLSKTWEQFKANLDTTLPRFGSTYAFDL